MKPEPQSDYCAYPNFFSSVVTPAVEKRLPEPGSIAGIALNHTTKVGPFFQNVSKDLCDDGKMGAESAGSALGFITRSATTTALVGGTVMLAGIGAAVAGSPLVAIGLGIAGLIALPPAAEWAARGVAGFFGEILAGVKRE